MITFVEGILELSLPTHTIINVGGIGYELLIPLSSYHKLPSQGSRVRLLTHHHVREDIEVLYGFFSHEERDLFRLLINHVSGVGPKLGLAVLSGMNIDQFKNAVVLSNTAAIAKISGIGKKTAERMILELKDKMGVAQEWAALAEMSSQTAPQREVHDAILALIALGYKQQEAEKTVHKVKESTKDMLSSSAIITESLKLLISS